MSSAVLAAGWALLPTATTQQDIDALIDTLGAISHLPLALTEPKASAMQPYRALARRGADAVAGADSEQEAADVRAAV